MVDTRKIIALNKYFLYVISQQSIIMAIVLFLNLFIGLISRSAKVGSIDTVTYGWSLILGIGLFSSTFKLSVITGMSRKSYYISTVISIFIMSAIVTVLTAIFSIISDRTNASYVMYFEMYAGNYIGLVLFVFTFCVLMFSLGYLIQAIYIKSSKLIKAIISGILVLIIPVIMLINVLSNGVVMNEIGRTFIRFMGLYNKRNPYLASMNFFIVTVTFLICIFLLIRKSELKE